MLGQVVLCLLIFSATCQRLEVPGQDSCPPPIDIQVCERTCYSDFQCRGLTKCCETACGGTVCTRPVTTRPLGRSEKPGSCPNPPTGRWICSNRCIDDRDCPTRLKCCKNRCGANACLVPV